MHIIRINGDFNQKNHFEFTNGYCTLGNENSMKIFSRFLWHLRHIYRVNSQASFDPTPSAVMNAIAMKINTNLKNNNQGM